MQINTNATGRKLKQLSAHGDHADIANFGSGNWNGVAPTAQLFIYFQVLDVVTTLVGFRIGANEASPFIRFLMQAGPLTGLVLSKLVALALAAACLCLGRAHLLRGANYWFAALLLWNLFVISARLGVALN